MKKSHKKLIDFKENLLRNNGAGLPYGYLDSKKSNLDLIDWLIGYYENRTGSSPKEYLESVINLNFHENKYKNYVDEMNNFNIQPKSEVDFLRDLLEKIEFLYNWVYYEKITGF